MSNRGCCAGAVQEEVRAHYQRMFESAWGGACLAAGSVQHMRACVGGGPRLPPDHQTARSLRKPPIELTPPRRGYRQLGGSCLGPESPESVMRLTAKSEALARDLLTTCSITRLPLKTSLQFTHERPKGILLDKNSVGDCSGRRPDAAGRPRRTRSSFKSAWGVALPNRGCCAAEGACEG